MAISAGPLFRFNEAISFMVYCESRRRSTTTGRSCRLIRRPSSVAGSRTGTGCRGRWSLRRWMRCCAPARPTRSLVSHRRS
jgi:hypothetical protein